MKFSLPDNIGPQSSIEDFAQAVAKAFENVVRPEGGYLKGGIIVTRAESIVNLRFGAIPHAISLVGSHGYAEALGTINKEAYNRIHQIFDALSGNGDFPTDTGELDMTPLAVRFPAAS